MIVKGIVDEDFVNYKKPSMLIAFPFCNLKCDKEAGAAICQNSPLLHQKNIEIDYDSVIERYLKNPITEAIVFQGMEPFDSVSDVFNLIMWLRIKHKCQDDVVIYTGYNKNEIDSYINYLKWLGNIIIKYGRYVPDQQPHYDSILGVDLASDNQYAERL